MPSLFDDPVFNARLFFPRPDTKACPADASDWMLSVEPGVELHARWHPVASSRATIVVFHGNGEIVSDYDEAAKRYHREVGADLLVVDFRGYGRSGGVANYRACIADSTRVIRELRLALGDKLREPLIALGRSLGGACAAEVACQAPPEVSGIVMESAPADPIGTIQRRGLSPGGPLSAEELAVFDPRPKLGRCSLPTLVLHGARDTTISPHEARANFAAIKHANKRLVWVAGRGHGDVLIAPDYFHALREFVEHVAAGKDASRSTWPRASGSRVSVKDGLHDLLSRVVDKLRRAAKRYLRTARTVSSGR